MAIDPGHILHPGAWFLICTEYHQDGASAVPSTGCSITLGGMVCDQIGGPHGYVPSAVPP